MKYPDALYPTILEGEIFGPVRCESLDGSEMFISEDHDQNTSTRFVNFKPFEKDGKTWGVTHLQFKSSKGWIKTDPSCCHWWRMSTLKKKDANGNWISGSESGIYIRKPTIPLLSLIFSALISWRWDVAGTVLDGVLRHWIPTKGFFGFHFD